ncbi:HK97 family phage prohead protease [Candidatus Cytomitobacter primus]|uniref:HK97 family phage prohead protease n=1 Tax=Candidatus Cytomitobacter primus TaxID=2066024 RepID=A0A5C0UEK4_9PROT|nr:HK97 family phage prohead protease [Candidatus Cytomitobacter primus]QEK38526.1 HK97 family phage prohead protease [Candidatus Cytomitobacter primus]
MQRLWPIVMMMMIKSNQNSCNIPANLEIKSINSDGIFEGYASVFGNSDLHGDIIHKKSFQYSLKTNIDNIHMLFQHDLSMPLGKWLKIEEDEFGLYVQGKIFRNLYMGQKVWEMLKSKIIYGLSIGFIPIIYKREAHIRTIFQIDLHEISIVKCPANPKAYIK